MKVPTPAYAAKTLLDPYGVVHLSRLESEPALGDLARDFASAQNRLREKTAMFSSARAELMRTKAVRDAHARTLNGALRDTYLTLLGVVGNPRTSPHFALYFPGGLTRALEAPLRAKILRAARIVAMLGQEPDERLRAHSPRLSDAAAAFERAFTAHRRARTVARTAFALLHTEKVAWLDAYRRSAASLRLRYYREPRRAEAFFKSVPREKTGKRSRGAKSKGETASSLRASQ